MTVNEHSTLESALPITLPEINKITLDHPWQWIIAGWQDIKTAPAISISYGVLFVLTSFLLTGLFLYMGMFFFVPALVAGFFLISPLLAMGLYEVSRCIARGEVPSFANTFMVWKRSSFNLLTMGLMLMMAFLVWMLLANIVFAIFFFGITPDFENALNVLFLSGDSPELAPL